MIQTQGLRFSYSSFAQFEFPDLECGANDSLLITGKSGKGKTTLLHVLGGLLKPHQGKILIDQTEITKLSSSAQDSFRGKHIGMVFQKMHFVASLSIMDNILLGNWLAQGKKDITQVNLLLKQLDIASLASKKPSQISTGQLQRAAIARALINKPKLLLADEPTSNLDDENALEVAKLLSETSKEFGTALIIVTHDSRLKNIFLRNIELT